MRVTKLELIHVTWVSFKDVKVGTSLYSIINSTT